MANADITSKLSIFLNQDSAEEPHLAGGLSQHGSCIAKQALDKVYPQFDKDNQGGMIPGKAFHQYVQSRLKSGTMFHEFLIVGHEQYVFYHREGKRDRLSPIDTLVYNTATEQYEIWDWKTTRVELKYVNELDDVYKYQGNFYAYLFKQMNGLKYWPVVRIIYANKADWCDLKEFGFISNESDAQFSMSWIEQVDELAAFLLNKPTRDIPQKMWLMAANGLDRWSHTKKPYRKICEYCNNKETCIKILAIPGFGVENLKQDEVPHNAF